MPPALTAFAPSTPAESRPASTRSRVSNRGGLQGLDQRSAAARRQRDVVADLTAELGADLSVAERLLVQAVARNTALAEHLAAAILRGETGVCADDAQRAANAASRDLERLRKGRRAKKPETGARAAALAKYGVGG